MRERPILMTPENAQRCHEGTKTQTRRLVNPQPLVDADGVHFLWASFTTTGHVHTFDREGIDGQQWFADYYPHENPYEESLKRTNYKNPCRYGVVGDRLWVRENGWERPARTPKMLRDGADTWERFYFDALLDAGEAEELKGYGFKRRPSIHMPRWACRTVLEITNIRVERLQEISEEDAIAEGVTCLGGVNGTYDRDDFSGCWTNYSSTETAAYWNSPIDSYHSLWDSINGVGSWMLNPWVWVLTVPKVG